METVLTRSKAQLDRELAGWLSGSRRALAFRGLAMIAFGVVVLVWPDISLHALTLLVVFFSMAYGLVTLSSALSAQPRRSRLWLLILAALDVAIGVAVLLWPDISSLALLYVLGTWATAVGLMLLVAPFWIPGTSRRQSAALVLSGVVWTAFGVVMLAKPSDGALVLLTLIGVFSIAAGATTLASASGIVHHHERAS
jgi:uncharacterized membrane protein HdeD (DUF308 family)